MTRVRLGNLLIVTGPSGTGKSTLLRRLIDEVAGLVFSVSHTTRAPREGELDGRDYHFVDEGTFADLVRGDAFLEHALVHGHWYGTSRAHLEEWLVRGTDVVLDIDVAGADQVRAKRPEANAIFILPPSFDELRGRLRTRAQDSDEVIATRLANATAEVRAVQRYDYAIINRDLDTCYAELKAIVLADRHRVWRQRAGLTTVLATFPEFK